MSKKSKDKKRSIKSKLINNKKITSRLFNFFSSGRGTLVLILILTLITGSVLTYKKYYGRGTSAIASYGQAAADSAYYQIGVMYRYGGCHMAYPLPTGYGCGGDRFDCSGLARWSWWMAGKRYYRDIKILGNSAAQMWSYSDWYFHRHGNSWTALKADLKPGDLIFFGSPVTHVAIFSYASNGVGYYVEANRTGVPVRTTKFTRTDAVGFTRPVN